MNDVQKAQRIMAGNGNGGRQVAAAPVLEIVEAPVSRSNQNSAPVLPHIVTRGGGISQIGGVGVGRAALPQTRMPRSIGLVCDNSGGGAAVIFMLFDPYGSVAAALPGTYSTPTLSTGPSYTALNQAIAVQPVVFAGVNYRVTTGSAQQFSESMRYAHAEVDGGLQIEPLFPQLSIRNTQQNANVLTIEQEFLIDAQSAILLSVDAGSVAVLDFFMKTQYNRLSQ